MRWSWAERAGVRMPSKNRQLPYNPLHSQTDRVRVVAALEDGGCTGEGIS